MKIKIIEDGNNFEIYLDEKKLEYVKSYKVERKDLKTFTFEIEVLSNNIVFEKKQDN